MLMTHQFNLREGEGSRGGGEGGSPGTRVGIIFRAPKADNAWERADLCLKAAQSRVNQGFYAPVGLILWLIQAGDKKTIIIPTPVHGGCCPPEPSPPKSGNKIQT